MSDGNKPFSSLGEQLRSVREKSSESLAEVSGAVEIDEQHLARIEEGLERPAEDILLLLISHFKVKDHEAVQLWELAEYDSELPDEIRIHDASHHASKQMVMVLAMDVRTMYTDGLDVTVNPSGVTLNFNQTTSNPQVTPVARVGMSHQQAELVIKTIEQALLHAKYNGGARQLPPPKE